LYCRPRDLHSFPTRRSSDLVRLLCICPGFVERELPGIPREWAGESRRQAETIRRFLEKQAASLAERDVKVSLECYAAFPALHGRSEEHTSELQSRENLVCRL